MKRLKILLLGIVSVSVLLLAGCGSDDGGGGGGGSSNLPGLTALRWVTAGGDALTGTATSGGNGGPIFFASNQDILIDDGRTRPTVSTNFLTATETADSVVTYNELASIAAPAIAGQTATFTLPSGTGFDLASGVTLDLSDAVNATVDSVVISSDSVIVIAGNVALTRSTADAVNLSFSTSVSATTGILVTGSVDGTGTATNDGGNIGASTSASGIMLLASSINLRGGLGGAALPGGDGGSLSVSADTDLVIPYGSFDSRGGSGTATGGTGGSIIFENYSGGGAVLSAFNWGFISSGGDGGTGNGGNAGSINARMGTGNQTAFSRLIAVGGNTTSGASAGNGSSIFLYLVNAGLTALTGTFSGTAYMTNDGGTATTSGNGGDAGPGLVFGAATINDGVMVGESSGGDSGTGGAGGNGSTSFVWFAANSGTNLRLTGTANGGTGDVNGGAGGIIRLRELTSAVTIVTYDMVVVSGTANGGNGNTGNGGNGGSVTLGNPNITGATITGNWTNTSVYGAVNGGTGVDGGNGGSVTAGAEQGTQIFTISGSANGGDANGTAGGSTNGGSGGTFGVSTNTGDITVTATNLSANGGAGADTTGVGGNGGEFRFHGTDSIFTVAVSGNANGGVGSGTGNGGAGGTLVISPNNNIVTNGGSATVDVTVNLRGGHAIDGSGGNHGSNSLSGATVLTTCGVAGSFTANSFNVNTSGFGSDTGNGNSSYASPWDATFAGPATFNGGTFTALAGDGSIVSGNGNGGLMDDIDINTTGFTITMTLNIVMGGGNAAGTGNCDGQSRDIDIELDSDSNGSAGSLTHSGTMSANAGNASGSGTGGAGGEINIDDNNATTGGGVTLNGTYSMSGGTSGSGTGGLSQGMDITVNGNVAINGSVLMNGGTGDDAGNGGSMTVFTDANIDMSSTVTSIGAVGVSTGGDGGSISLGNNSATLLTLTGNCVLRANGGSGTTDGAAGSITLDPSGVAPSNPNLVETAGSVVETNDGGGTAVPGNQTRD